MAASPSQHATHRVVAENVDAVLRMEEESLARQTTRADAISDRIACFIGTIAFVLVHVLLFFAYLLVNTGLVPGLVPFDPYPFSFLSVIVSAEGVLLSTFVLIRQNRMAALSDRRDHLDLQVNLLTEREVTRLLQMMERVGERLGLDRTDSHAGAFSEPTDIEAMVEHLDEKLSIPSGS